MTQLMGRPILGLPGELGARSVLADLLAGARAALLTLAVIAVPVLGLWVLAPYADDTAAGAGRLACALWLLGHGAPLIRGQAAAPLTVTPLLPMVFTAALLYRTGVRLGRAGRRGRAAWRAPLAICAGYLAVAAAAVAQCGTEGVLRARPLPDLLTVAVLVAASLGAGFRSETGSLPLLWRLRLPSRTSRTSRTSVASVASVERVPGWARPVGGGPAVRRAAGAGGLGLVAAGGLVLIVAVVLGTGAAGRSVQGAGGGAAGFAGQLLACALLLPNAVLWAAAYSLGTGFAVGTGTVVAPTGTRLGAVPDFPLFALLPEPGGAGWQLAACGLPLLAGLVPAVLLGRAAAGIAGRDGAGRGDTGRGDTGRDDAIGEPGAARRPDEERSAWHPAATALAALGSSLLVGAGAALFGGLAGGALAGGRMSELGPVSWQAGLAAAAWLSVVTVPGALLTRWWLTRAGAPSWWQRISGLALRRTAGARVTLHRVLVWAADLPSPLARWRRSR